MQKIYKNYLKEKDLIKNLYDEQKLLNDELFKLAKNENIKTKSLDNIFKV